MNIIYYFVSQLYEHEHSNIFLIKNIFIILSDLDDTYQDNITINGMSSYWMYEII